MKTTHSDCENDLVYNDTQSTQSTIHYSDLLRYSTKSDKILMIIGAFAAFANGAAFPIFSFIIGGMTDTFASSDLVYEAGMKSIQFLIVGACTMICSFIMFSTWMITGERQGIQFRKEYLRSILHQDVGWFDSINPNELSTKVATESFEVQGAIGEKVTTFIMTVSMSFFGFLIGFIKGWQLAIVITATLPAMSICTALFSITIQGSEAAKQSAYSEAGANAEQAINAIKTVKMLDGEVYETAKYTNSLIQAVKKSTKYNLYIGLAFGLMLGSMIWSYALGFWYGSKLIANQTINDNTGSVYTAGDVLTIFFTILTGGFSIGQAGPCLTNFSKGKAAALRMFAIIDRQSKILNPIHPQSLDNFNGEIVFKDIYFSYPSRPDTPILNGINFTIPAGKKVALVGESGCGKSTIMQLIERFYDTDSGDVLFGGNPSVNVKDIHLKDLRARIGMVGQEPVLFATSIRENLLYGKMDATEVEIIEALKKVNAQDFVSRMDQQLETYVGIGGGQLSGGQKQRIAIARAILKKPQVLLLDEATSALDRTNEKLIQQTLDEVSKGITTIVIAHRLSTIQNADLILVVDNGVIVEQGTHDELMALHGKYETLAKNQIQAVQKDQTQLEDIELDEQQVQPKQHREESINHRSNPLENPNIVMNAIDEIEKFKELEVPKLFKGLAKNDLGQTAPRQDSTVQNTQSPPNAQMGRLFAYSKDERLYFVFGLLGAMGNGAVFPVFSLFLAQILTILIDSNPKYADANNKEASAAHVQDRANQIALWFFLCGVAQIAFWTILSYFLGMVGEKLSLKLRQETYQKLLRMAIPFFDEPKNNAGTLTSRLSVDCKLIQGLTSSILGINISNMSAIITGMAIAFSNSWALTLIVLGLSPMAFLGGVLQAKFVQGFSDLTDEAYKDSGNLIMETVTNIKTVFSFGNEEIILDIYSSKVQQPLLKAKKRAVFAGLAFGFAQIQYFIINSVVFYVGAIFVDRGYIDIEEMFTSIVAITYATMGAGNNAAFAGDIAAVKNAAKNIFEILDAEDEFQIEQRMQRKQLKTNILGNIEVDKITFKYAGRDKNVFEDLSVSIPTGQKVAFVGPSGCGKSTIMQMLMRFYDPDKGQIRIDGVDILDYDIRHLRRQLAIVSQEPVLFKGTIKENIQYNLDNIGQQEIEDAARQANAYDFIMKNQFEEPGAENQPVVGQGFDRQVGPKGGQISGGQKQRIAIARALLRNSKILLLDEATSALDASSEALVQDSLNAIMKNKTTLAIAHRISTIKDSECIYVFQDGKIVEQGNYQYLVSLRGAFYRLEQGIAH